MNNSINNSINFFSSKDSNETPAMLSRSDNIDIMTDNETGKINEELLESLLQKYQKGLEESMKGSEFVFDSIDLLYYKLRNKVSLNRSGSFIGSPKWFKNKKTTISPKNNDDRCFEYAITIVL